MHKSFFLGIDETNLGCNDKQPEIMVAVSSFFDSDIEKDSFSKKHYRKLYDGSSLNDVLNMGGVRNRDYRQIYFPSSERKHLSSQERNIIGICEFIKYFSDKNLEKVLIDGRRPSEDMELMGEIIKDLELEYVPKISGKNNGDERYGLLLVADVACSNLRKECLNHGLNSILRRYNDKIIAPDLDYYSKYF